ncbi:MAG: 2-amino-4-hydroxy-6-hydroxymethyldihydropteridine diphosphokinase [Patescibacteria group bacterium]
MVNNAYIALGTNLGDRTKNLLLALSQIEEFSVVKKKSSIYETVPVGYLKQNDFLNMVVELETVLSPVELFGKLQSIEKNMGRVKTILNGPRIIDLDILFYNNQIINNDQLIIPHPRLAQRKFVLEPLAEIASDFIHPSLNCSILNLLKQYESKENS